VCTKGLADASTRLQVEHGITEMCYNVDLVGLMLRQAEMQARGDGGIPLDQLLAMQTSAPVGFAIEARVYAEVPSRDFAPSPGLLQYVQWHQTPGSRVDTWITSGTNISPFYDPMIAKVMVWDETSHDGAVDQMLDMLRYSKVQGCPTNFQYLSAIVSSPGFRIGDTTTAFLTSDHMKFIPQTIDVIAGGAYTTVQDLPARLGVGHGVPESGPLDSVSFRLANILVGNHENTEALEITLMGPELLFNIPAVIAVTGGKIACSINGEPVDTNTTHIVPANGIVKLGVVSSGCRSYLGVKGGFPNIPLYLGSKSTTSTLKLGGYQGRQLVANDSLDLDERSTTWAESATILSVPVEARLDNLWSNDWSIYVMPGPHDDPEFLTDDGKSFKVRLN
jgi:urea carboxylase